MKRITITRKIEIYPIGDKEVRRKSWDLLRGWDEMVFRACNTAASHLYFQEQMRQFFYLTDEAKILFTDINKPIEKLSEKEKLQREEGYIPVLNTSKQNTTYRVLSDKYKGDMPSDIFSNLNAQLAATFSKECKDYFSGKRSLRSYKRGTPMPFSSKSIRNLAETEDKRNYTFTLLGIDFKTKFGRDLSGNKMIFDRSLTGEYKLCNSSLKLDGKKLFLLAVFQFDKDYFKLDENKSLLVRLSLTNPIVAFNGKKEYSIGTKEEFLHRRLAIQQLRRRTQIGLRYTNGGKGRKSKLKKLDDFEKMEKNYVTTKMHAYSRRLVDYCITKGYGEMVLQDQSDEMKSLNEHLKEIKGDNSLSNKERRILEEKYKFVIANWSYYGLKQMIEYKCAKAGIELIDDSKELKDNEIEEEISS